MSHPYNQTLGEICDEVDGIIRTGPFGSQLHKSDYRDEGLPVIMPKNIINGRIELDGIARIGKDDEFRLREHKLAKGDIVYARRGDIGRCALIRERENGWLCGTGSLRISLGNKIVSPVYLYYYLNHPYIISWIQNQAVGATMPNLNTTIVRSIPISYPPLPTQRKIAAILSAYDDLIENNTRRIQILEEMAQTLYRHWFVDYKFPGHEDVRMVDSGTEFGEVPEGWEISTVSELCEFVSRGVTPKYQEGSQLYIINQRVNRGPSLDRAYLKELQPELEVPKEKYAQVNDLLINSLGEGTLGRVHLFTGPDREWAVDQHMSICRSSSTGVTKYLYFLMASDEGQARIQAAKTGATNMTMFNISSLRDFNVITPPEDLLITFDEFISPLFELKRTHEEINLLLQSTRDLLLPRLVSGEVDMSELDISGVEQ